MPILKNDLLEVTINELGAELRSVRNVHHDFEYMWSAQKDVWARVSPVLFPIVGKLKDDNYIYKSKNYQLKQHGYARDQVFSVEHYGTNLIRFIHESNAQTKEFYPFDYRLTLQYELSESEVILTYFVENTSDQEMYFSIGAHPGFCIPNIGNAAYNQYYLQFDKDNALEHYLIDQGLISDRVERIELKDGKLHLDKSLFLRDALVMKSLKSTKIGLHCTDHPHGLELQSEDFPYYGIWAQKHSDFVCLEPWCGIADSNTHNQQLTEKEGIIRLESTKVFSRIIRFRFF